MRPEPGSVRIKVPALAAVKLWRSRRIVTCDLLKLDCEGAEISILRALAEAGLLAQVHRIVGEWHTAEPSESARQAVRRELETILGRTHAVVFQPDRGGREGHFTAHATASSPTERGVLACV